MQEIKFPEKRTFWKTDGANHEGFTDTNQVTTTGQPNMTQSEDASLVYPALPTSGWLEIGDIYSYESNMVQVVQAHERTIFAPEETPALFSVYRANTDGMEWVAGEQVTIGDERLYNSKTYKCLQSHQTQETWTPESTLNVLWKMISSEEEILVWVQPVGAVDAYNIGDKVYFPTAEDSVYESLIDANVWSPTVYPAGWTEL